MKNKGLFSTLFIEDVKGEVELDDLARGRMATLSQTWQSRDKQSSETLWNSFLKQAVSYLRVVPPAKPSTPGVYPLYEDFAFTNIVTVLYLAEPGTDLDDTSVGRFCPGKLVGELKRRSLNWGILTDGAQWRLYSLKTAKPYEDFVELNLAEALGQCDEDEYALFERFFHRDSFVKETPHEESEKSDEDDSKAQVEQAKKDACGVYKCRLDRDREASEKIIEKQVKDPLLAQVDEILQYLCNGFIADTERKGTEYSEEERRDIFESAVKLLYRCLFLFYAEARSLLPSEPDKAEVYRKHSILNLCQESHRFKWGQRKDTDGYDLWKRLKGLINAVNDGDPEYGIMGYNGGLFDDAEEKFLGKHKLRNDYLARALYLLAYVEPLGNEPEDEYPIPYADLEVRHLGELYENILEFTVMLADVDRIRRRTKKGVQILLGSETKLDTKTDSRIRKGDVFFGETALERKQTGSYYTPETLVHFLNQKAIINPLRQRFDNEYRPRFEVFCKEATSGRDLSTRRGAAQSAVALVERFVEDVVLKFRACDPAMGSGHFLVNAANQMTELIVELLAEVPYVEGLKSRTSCTPNHWRRLVTRHCLYGVDLNRLAVHLAKLSLWLNSFARDHRLTFLDHHLKHGNSLIGIRALDRMEKLPARRNEPAKATAQGLLFSADMKKACQHAIAEIERIGKVDEDATDRMKELFDGARDESAILLALADLHMAYLIDPAIKEEDYRDLFADIAKGDKPRGILTDDILQRVSDLRDRHRFFHWAIEFPDVFQRGGVGFDATVGNPPWDMVSAQPAEFFGRYDRDFRSLSRSESVKRMTQLCERHKEIARQWAEHQRFFDEANAFLNTAADYGHAPTGRNNLYHYFLHRSHDLLHSAGVLAVVLPGSFNTDKGSIPLRQLFLNQTAVQCFFCFSNEKFIFRNVHHAFRFILFATRLGDTAKSFPVCFLTDPREAIRPGDLAGTLGWLEGAGLRMGLDTLKQLSPGRLNIMEFKKQQDIDLATKLYSTAERLGEQSDGLRFRFSIEMMSNTDAGRFTACAADGIPVFAGRNFHQYNHQLSPPTAFIPEEELVDVHKSDGSQPWKHYRLVFRDVAGGTNERTSISCILPPEHACLETARILYPTNINGTTIEEALLYSLAILNSLCFDFLLRFVVRTHVSQHILERVPFKRCSYVDPAYQAIVARACRLSSRTPAFVQLWAASFRDSWKDPTFWYPRGSIADYGPADERALRKRLVSQARSMASVWTPECGVHDLMPDQRDAGDRAQLRAEIDAYVAHLYGLSRDEFAYIIETFPVMKKRERQAFGEFISKRKCLEEYDRLAPIVREAK